VLGDVRPDRKRGDDQALTVDVGDPDVAAAAGAVGGRKFTVAPVDARTRT